MWGIAAYPKRTLLWMLVKELWKGTFKRPTPHERRAAELQALRRRIDAIRPEPCCNRKPMRESNGRITMCCEDGCPWEQLDYALATAMVEADLISPKARSSSRER